MVSIGNQDLVQVNGNREGTRVVITNFNQPQGNPEMGIFSYKSSMFVETVLSKLTPLIFFIKTTCFRMSFETTVYFTF